MADKDFYFLRNVEAKVGDTYSALNEALEEAFANVRLGPPLTKRGNPSVAMLQDYAGLYMRKSDRVFALREQYGEAKFTLQEAESKLEKIMEKGIQDVGYGGL